MLSAAIITGLRLARDPRAGCLTERVIDAVEDRISLANQIYDKALLGSVREMWIIDGEACSLRRLSHYRPSTGLPS